LSLFVLGNWTSIYATKSKLHLDLLLTPNIWKWHYNGSNSNPPHEQIMKWFYISRPHSRAHRQHLANSYSTGLHLLLLKTSQKNTRKATPSRTNKQGSSVSISCLDKRLSSNRNPNTLNKAPIQTHLPKLSLVSVIHYRVLNKLLLVTWLLYSNVINY
jgi:hypothetical protein